MNNTTDWLSSFSAIGIKNWVFAASLLLLGILLSRLTRAIIQSTLGKTININRAKVWGRVSGYFVLGIFFAIALSQLGFQLSVILGAAGIFSVAIGFAAQTSTSNLISGLFLMIEKPFIIGDVLEIEGTRGEVIAIDWLSITLKMMDNTAVRVPNELIIKQTLKNITRHPIRRIDIPVGIAYKEKISPVRELLIDIVDKNEKCLSQPEPKVWVTGFGASSVDLQLSVFVRKEVFMDTKSMLLETIKCRFDEQGIEIPFPHHSIYTGTDSAPFPIKLVTPDELSVKPTNEYKT